MPKQRWGWPKSVNWKGLPSSSTSFCIFTIRDSEFSPELLIFLVYNHADKGGKKVSLLAEFDSIEGKKKGKPAGYGMPGGGGLNPEWLENQEDTAVREGSHESGIRVIRTRLIPMPGKNKVLFLDKRTDELIRWVPYEDGKQASIKLRPGEKILLNPMNYYLADVDWLNSKPRKFFLKLRDELITGGVCTQEDVARFGLSINTLTREGLLELGVDEEEVDEIGGFALLPISFLRWMWESNQFFLDLDEEPKQRFEKDALTTYVYYSHVKRILEGLEIMGVA